MKLWMLFVLLTVMCWGAYVPMIHHGQMAMGKGGQLRAFLFVGLAYFVIAVLVPALLLARGVEPREFTRSGMTLATLAGVLGALGALGIIFASKYGGKPIFVAPLVFGGAPIINTFVAMTWDKPQKAPSAWFYIGILLAAAGAALVLRFKPST